MSMQVSNRTDSNRTKGLAADSTIVIFSLRRQGGILKIADSSSSTGALDIKNKRGVIRDGKESGSVCAPPQYRSSLCLNVWTSKLCFLKCTASRRKGRY